MDVLQPNQRVGEFEIVRLLGKGGMGQVYEARQLNPARSVALKVLAPWLADDEDALKRFWREAAVPAQLDHPAIVRIISTGKTREGIAYYVMQLVRGISLSDLIKLCHEPQTNPHDVPTMPDDSARAGNAAMMPAGEPPPSVLAEYRGDRYRFAARFGAVAARALAHAHQQGFLHRDVKPSNLMIDHHSQLYMVDFGLTRALDPGAMGTRSGQIRGTPWYMSPEQARGEPVDERSDIYSLGVTLYELITQGEGPFSANRNHSDAVMAQVRAGQVVPLLTLAPEVPPKLEQIILQAMDFRAERRYRSASALAADLEDTIHNPSSPTLTHGKPRQTGPRWFANRQWLRAAALLAAVLLMAAVVRFLFDSDVPGQTPETPALAPNLPKGPDTAAELEKLFNRRRSFNVLTPLLRQDFLPDISSKLWGNGTFSAPTRTGGLQVHSPNDNIPTVIALDYLPRAAFEFSIELNRDQSITLNENALGIVFGWPGRTEDSQASQDYFCIQFDKRSLPNCPHGRLTVGIGRHLKGEGARGGFTHWLRPLPGGRGLLNLPESGKEGWHTVQVRATKDAIEVSVDGSRPESLQKDWLRDKIREQKDLVSDPRGAVGIWVRNGLGRFRNAFIVPLAE